MRGHKGLSMILALLLVAAVTTFCSSIAQTPTQPPDTLAPSDTAGPPPGPTPTQAADAQPAATLLGSAPTLTADAQPAGAGEQSLSAQGPWVVYTAATGAYVMNPDGSGVKMLHPFQMITPYVMSSKIWAAPQGGRVAVLELIWQESAMQGFPRLKVLRVPSGEVELELPLLPPDWKESDYINTEGMSATEATAYLGTMPMEQLLAAIGGSNQMAWSHDGSLLAFNAAIDGPSADLYLYDTRDGSVTRLTDGPSQSVSPVFSPDDRYILHGAVESLNWGYSGAGYNYLNVWAARSDNSGVERVFNHEFYGYEEVLGWLSDTEYLAASWENWCYYFDLRVVDLDGGQRSLYPAHFDMAAFDPQDGKLLFSVTGTLNDCTRQQEPGLYLMDLNGQQVTPVVTAMPAEDISSLSWSEQAGVFFVTTLDDVLYTVDAEGGITQYTAPAAAWDPPLVSPDGARWAFVDTYGSLLAFGDAQGGYSQFSLGMPGPLWWQADSSAVVLFGEQDGKPVLFSAQLPDLTPALLPGEDIMPPTALQNMVLVQP